MKISSARTYANNWILPIYILDAINIRTAKIHSNNICVIPNKSVCKAKKLD
jgi:hypothetical protein